jgi:hypothetical protein
LNRSPDVPPATARCACHRSACSRTVISRPCRDFVTTANGPTTPLAVEVAATASRFHVILSAATRRLGADHSSFDVRVACQRLTICSAGQSRNDRQSFYPLAHPQKCEISLRCDVDYRMANVNCLVHLLLDRSPLAL